MNFVIARFDPAAKYNGYNQFDCRHPVINKFVKDSLKKQVQQNLSVAYAVLDESANAGQADRFVGFFTIANHALPLSALSALQLGSLPQLIPCVRLIMLGVNHADAGHGLGKQLMNHAFDIAKAGARHSGCFGVYLDADPDAVGFYQKLGFHFLAGNQGAQGKNSPMFIPMSAIP